MPKQIDEQKLLNQVIRSFVEQGYQGATTKEIAAKAGINEATLFRKYGSKSRLFIAALGGLIEQLPLNKVAYTGELEGDLATIVEKYQKTFARYGDLVPSIMTEIERNPELKPVTDQYRPLILRVGGVLLRYQKEGKLIEENIVHSLGSLLGPIFLQAIAARNFANIGGTRFDTAGLVQRFLEGRRG